MSSCGTSRAAAKSTGGYGLLMKASGPAARALQGAASSSVVGDPRQAAPPVVVANRIEEHETRPLRAR